MNEIHLMPGYIGHFLIITAFVFALLSAIAYFLSLGKNIQDSGQWARFARISFRVHVVALLGVVVSLFYIIYNHYFEYHYAWSHSSLNLPTHYMISCFWEGQEGSFLLWLFWNAILGLIIIKTNRSWQAPVMIIFALVQAFLASMILGVVIGDLKIGSSPFILLRDAMDAPIFKTNPNYVPTDGTGLNPLLQNYWMVIHPPTLFLGFATTLIPFAFAISGLYQKRYTEWIRPALPWALFSAAVLGLGILMGGYWAYETLNFGGYWNWDPVENAVYVPWLVLVASIHTMISFKKNDTALKAALILSITTFILILYSTFLTRSGILGNASVHSFTDLGLSGQLLLYLLAFTFLAIFLIIYRWRNLPGSKEEVSTYSREFWIFMGATVLCLAAFQVIAATSIPVYNSLLQSFGVESNLAPPADQVSFYTRFQLWFALLIACLSGVGQYFWWKKIDRKSLLSSLSTPFVITMLVSAGIIVVGNVGDWKLILLLTASVFTIVANSGILIKLLKSNPKLSGGAVAHIGLGMILIGILFSSGYSEVISLNNSGLVYHKQFSEEMNRENILLWYNTPVSMGKYEVTYKGKAVEASGFPGFVRLVDVNRTDDPFKLVLNKDLEHKGKILFTRGDTLNSDPVNTFYEVEYVDKDSEKTFTLFPRAQVNPSMGLLASPDIKRKLGHDLYTHVSSIPDPGDEKEWKEKELHQLAVGDTFFLNDYIAVFSGVSRVTEVKGLDLSETDVAVKAIVQILDKSETVTMEPMMAIDEGMIGKFPDEYEPMGLRFTLEEINPVTGLFTLSSQITQKDYVILKAVEKPAINVLWIGTLVLMLGFGLATVRRYQDFRKMRDKGIE